MSIIGRLRELRGRFVLWLDWLHLDAHRGEVPAHAPGCECARCDETEPATPEALDAGCICAALDAAERPCVVCSARQAVIGRIDD